MPTAKEITEGPAIGIDLGTTFSCVAVVRNGKVEIIANEQGNFTTPSYVSFNELERLIGDPAKQQIAANATNTVFDAKRLIGRKFDDEIVQKDMHQWPFKVVNENSIPKIEVTFKDEVKRFAAEEISAMVLGKMKEIAESYLNTRVTNAVVTVPAYFNDLQRRATRDAGTIAGLNVSRIINEPIAAAIAYGLTNDTKGAKNILVYDLGGGTFDVAILSICGNVYEVKAVGGDTHLGGEDFDNILMKSLATEFERKHKVDISGNKRALRKLRAACERAKRTLSSATHAPIEIDSLCDGIDFTTNLSRARFDDLCGPLFRMTIKVVEETLKSANLKSSDIDKVVLVGGSTRIPKIQKLLTEKFSGKEINKTINPDEAVAYGAAVLAAIIHGNASEEMEHMKLVEVTPLTLGINSIDRFDDEINVMSELIARNTPIPESKSKVFRTSYDNQTAMLIQVLQGEYYFAEDNYLIGEFVIEGIPRASALVESVTVTFSIDANGILAVTAVSNSNENVRGEIKIKNVCGSLTKEEIDRMVADAETYRADDEEMRKYQTERYEFEEYCRQINNQKAPGRRLIRKKCMEALSWLESCYRPTVCQFLAWKNVLKALSLRPTEKPAHPENDENEEDVEVVHVKAERKDEDYDIAAVLANTCAINDKVDENGNNLCEAREAPEDGPLSISLQSSSDDDDIEIVTSSDVVFEIDED